MSTISIADFESALNACKAANPPVDYVLGKELRAFAEIYGLAIYAKAIEIRLDMLSSERRELVQYWLNAARQSAL